MKAGVIEMFETVRFVGEHVADTAKGEPRYGPAKAGHVLLTSG
jgi:hypothetical protein